MPRDKDLKRLVRARMKKTGEAYTAARAQVVRKAPRKSPVRAATPTPRATARATPSATTPRADHATVAGMSDAAVEAKTGATWQRWVERLDADGAAALAHRDIARLVHEKYGVGNWWTQMVTVGYERIKGLRAAGQRRDGSYEASKSRTFDVPVDVLFGACADARTRRRWLAEPGVTVRTATAPKSMRLAWSDGGIVALWFTPKGKAKSALAVTHTKLPDKETANRFKLYWAERLDALAAVLAGGRA